LWRQVAQALRNDIVGGKYTVGARLPTEDELARTFSVSRHTVRLAIKQLRIDGLVESRQGSGTIVTAPTSDEAFNVHRVASIDELIAYAGESRYVIDHAEMIASEAVADTVSLPAGGKWLRMRGFRVRNDGHSAAPLCSTEVFIAAEYAGVERVARRHSGPIWQLIEDMYGVRIVEVDQMLRVRPVPESLEEGLGLGRGASLVEVQRSYRTSTGEVAELSVNLFPAEHFRFSMKLRRPSLGT
jgi:DNA-binding GntR family transcriptional regulator